VTIPASTLLGLDDQAGDLEGHGPVDAVTARALAAGGTWQRIVTDPLSGTVLDVGRTRYRPPAALDEHVRVRDRHCAAPGCTIPATRADVDHTREYRSQNTRPDRDKELRPLDRGGGRPLLGAAPGVARGVAPVAEEAPIADRITAPRNHRDAVATAETPTNRRSAPASGALGATAAHNLGVLCRRHHQLKTDGGFRLRQLLPGFYLWITPGNHAYLTRPGTDQVLDITTRTTPVDPDDPPF
jgi:hypothetical protein